MGVFKAWLGVALALAEFAVLPHCEGACLYRGSLLADATIWKPDSCQNCRCHGDIVICKPVVCKNPRCAFEKVPELLTAVMASHGVDWLEVRSGFLEKDCKTSLVYWQHHCTAGPMGNRTAPPSTLPQTPASPLSKKGRTSPFHLYLL